MRPAALTKTHVGDSFNRFFIPVMIALTGIMMGITIVAGDIGYGTLVAFVPLLFGIAALIIFNPLFGLVFIFNFSFFFIGLSRYFTQVPLGLIFDSLLFLTTLSAVFRITKNNIANLNKGVFYSTLVWFIYTVLEIFNPNAPVLQSWFYASRSVTFYAVQLVPLTLLLFNKKENLNYFIKYLCWWGVASTIWGLKQTYVYVDSFEEKWLLQGGNLTHVILGRLKAFSFYADAQQYGITMAYVALISLILALGSYTLKQRFWYVIVFIICLIGIKTSGIVGPLMVILFGIIVYIIITRNIRLLIIGSITGILAFGLLNISDSSNSKYLLHNIKSAVSTNNPTLGLALQQHSKLRNYLSDKPFGTGMGTTDGWAERFYPNSLLAKIPTGSWFVKIWTETGIAGLLVFALSLSYVFVFGSYQINKLKNNNVKQKIIALYAGFAGIVITAFIYPAFGSAPLVSILYISMAIICVAYVYDDYDNQESFI